MEREKADAEAISKYVGSLGDIGEPPEYYFVQKAAKILGCSYLELESRADKTDLMSKAFSIEWGNLEGEYLREINPLYHQKRKAAEAKITAARGK